jgi:hypothetical protein
MVPSEWYPLPPICKCEKRINSFYFLIDIKYD